MDELLDTAPCGFLSFADDGTILIVNKRLAHLVEFSTEELTGKNIETILSVGGRVFYHTHFFPLLKMQGMAEEIYFSLRSKSGAEIPVLTNAARQERDGRPVNDCVFVRMRQRRRYEDELLRARKAADLASEAKAKFLSMMSHDLRTPLQAISGYADLLLLDEDDGETKERSYLRAIKSAGNEMLRLINDILGFAQLDSGNLNLRSESLAIADVLTRAETLMRIQFEQRKIRYGRRECLPDLRLSADADRLQQVLLNLLTNAAKFTPPGGEVWISCESEAAVVHIHVSDTGIGIAEDQVNRVFEPFVQVDDAKAVAGRRQGVGLGLSISRDLVRAMGGNLTVTSEVGRGSKFTITLPKGTLSS